MRLIGINGFKRSGKGETGKAVADVLSDVKFETTHLLGFADKVKVLGARILGFLDLSEAECIALMDQCKESWEFAVATYGSAPELDSDWSRMRLSPHWTTKEPVTTITGRQYLQNIGTEARKVFGADFWVDQVLPTEGLSHFSALDWLDERYDTDCVAFTDLRFENEAERVLGIEGGEVWEVIRPGTKSDGHDSEQVLPRHLITRQIDNSGDLANLRFQVEKALGV